MKENIKNKCSHKILMLVMVILVLVFAACSSSKDVLASAIQRLSEGLNCLCDSCELILSECDCETAVQQTAVIKNGLSKGLSDEQIIQDLIQQYGQQVVASE